MGLDSYLSYYEPCESEVEHIYNKLVGEKKESKELLYWRKRWEIIDWFSNQLIIEIENCSDYKIDKEIILKLLHALENDEIAYDEWGQDFENSETKKEDIAKLKEVIAREDFDKIEFVFSNWW